jgi:hypothetical protein
MMSAVGSFSEIAGARAGAVAGVGAAAVRVGPMVKVKSVVTNGIVGLVLIQLFLPGPF